MADEYCRCEKPLWEQEPDESRLWCRMCGFYQNPKRNNVVQLVNWNGTEGLALIQQLTKRVTDALEQGKIVGVAAVLILEQPDDPDGSGRTYEACYTMQSPEVTLFAAKKLELSVLQTQRQI